MSIAVRPESEPRTVADAVHTLGTGAPARSRFGLLAAGNLRRMTRDGGDEPSGAQAGGAERRPFDPERKPDPYDLPDDLVLPLEPVGVVRSPYTHHPGTPRQASRDGGRADGFVVLRPGWQNTLAEIRTFSHIWILYWMHHGAGHWNEKVRAPRDGVKRGVFATRAPHRPNPIGMSCVELRDVRGVTLRIRGLDILDGSPVLDIKPYVPYADRVDEANGGWTDALALDEGPDHRDTRTVGRRWWSGRHRAD